MTTHRTGVIVLVFTLLPPLAAQAANAPGQRVEISADYRYAFHEGSETAAEAKTLACREALRLAVTNSPLFRDQTESVVDSRLLRDIAHLLVTRHVQDQQIVEQTERGRTVSCRIHGFLPAEDSARAIRVQLDGGPVPTEGLDQNRILRIVGVREEANGVIAVQYQALKRLDWLGTHYQGGLRESADIMVDFYDDQGFLIRTESHPARRTPTGEDVMSPGEIAVLKVAKPRTAKTYRVWLVK